MIVNTETIIIEQGQEDEGRRRTNTQGCQELILKSQSRKIPQALKSQSRKSPKM